MWDVNKRSALHRMFSFGAITIAPYVGWDCKFCIFQKNNSTPVLRFLFGAELSIWLLAA